MNNVNYLSTVNYPEINLAIIAKDKIFFTQKLTIQIGELEKSNFQLFLSRATTIAVVAIGIILGVTVSLPFGACVTVAAIIPYNIWMNFRDQNRSVQLTFDQEKEKLEEIYQNMIENLQLRFTMITKYCELIGKYGKAKFQKSELLTDFADFTKFKDMFYDMHTKTDQEEADKEELAKVVRLFGQKKSDPDIDINEFGQNVRKIAYSRLENDVLKDKLVQLKGLCKTYTDFISQE